MIIGAITVGFVFKNDDPRDQLLLAISKGDIKKLEKLEKNNNGILDEWITFDGYPFSGYFPIQYALYLRQVLVVHYMLDRDVNTNRIIGNGTPLGIAMADYNYPMITKMIEHGADVNYGIKSPLWLSVYSLSNMQKKIDIIMENGASFHNQEEKEESILALKRFDYEEIYNKINNAPIMLNNNHMSP